MSDEISGGDRLETVQRHYRILEALLETYERAIVEKWGVVRYNLYSMFEKIIAAASRELPGLLPSFTEEQFLEENSSVGKLYNVAAIRASIKSALAALEGDMSLARSAERRYMELAIERASKAIAEDARPRPKVGVVIVRGTDLLVASFRGEGKAGEHAEYTALEGQLSNVSVIGATVYTTLEPCTTRNHPKIPCAARLVERKVGRVVIGMLDPDPRITGRGVRLLRAANIEVELFPGDLASRVEEMNREFTRGVTERTLPVIARTPLRVEFPKRNGIGGVSVGGGFFPEWNLPIRLVAPESAVTLVDIAVVENGYDVWERGEIIDVRGRPVDLPINVANATELWIRSRSRRVLEGRPTAEAFGSFELRIRDHTQPEGEYSVYPIPDRMKTSD